MAGLRFTDVQSRPTDFLDLPSGTLEAFQQLVPPFEAVFQAYMAAWRLDAAPGGEPQAPQAPAWAGAPVGAARSASGAAPALAAERACPPQCQARSSGPRAPPSVDRGYPRWGDGPLLGAAPLPGAPHALAAYGLIGINSMAFPHSCWGCSLAMRVADPQV
jgi:hypothetical protein